MKRTIQEVLNKENGKTIDADIFFNKSKNEIWKRRIELQEVIKGVREPIFVCYYCSQNIKINGVGTYCQIMPRFHGLMNYLRNIKIIGV